MLSFALLGVYLAAAVVLIFVLLFGETPFFYGTPVASVHWFLTQGIFEGVEWLVRATCGQRAVDCTDRWLVYFCDGSHPYLQIFYLSILSLGYALYWSHIFLLLPNRYASEVHIYTGTLAVGCCLATFLLASYSDPGTVTKRNVECLLVTYPYDNILFEAKDCRTCLLPRPARSKHCNVCNICVARHDHHCAWINNCVGLLNMRLFLAFLLANIAMCVYATCLGLAVLWGDLDKHGVLTYSYYDRKQHKRRYLTDAPARLIEWILVYYPVPVAVIMFTSVATLLVLGFLIHQMHLIYYGSTTYEIHKRRLLQHAAMDELVQAAALSNEARISKRGAQNKVKTTLATYKLNIYDKGFCQNLKEILFPYAGFKKLN